ncbi:MAG: sigma-54 dependent transcriptional regulator [Desulfuromonadaceae bacterium]|nr:sigma-54 dependent transcriptional regulator [Desulfuromonadaceae bacterium]
MPHILIVDDEKNYCTVMSRLLQGHGYQTSTATNPFAALEQLTLYNIQLILSDLKMPLMNGMDFLHQVQRDHSGIPFIIITAHATVETALEAIKAGAFDYLLKPFDNQKLLLTISKALDYAKLRDQNKLLRQQLERSHSRELLGESPAIRQLLSDIERVGPEKSSVLIAGESGTGKELVARSMHRTSPRSSEALVSLNCAAFAEQLLESELFGHERGAFTGATERKRGLFELADGGTLFLDEIGELPLALQPKLLRVLQEKRFRRVGATNERECDVRILAATNRPLEQLIRSGRFREDLYYRLNVVSLEVPPLRQRREDIPLLATFFLQRFAQEMGRPLTNIAANAMAALQAYDWPGNVRELENAIERAVIFSNGDSLQLPNLPAPISSVHVAESACPDIPFLEGSLPEKLDALEKQLIHQALRDAQGIQAQAAERLGISRSNLQYKLRKYKLI